MFEVHLGALHDDESVLVFEILVDFHFCDEVPIVLDHVLAFLRKIPHERDLLQEVPVFVIVFNLYLFKRIMLSFYDCGVDVRIAPS